VHFEPDSVSSKVFTKKEDIEYEESLKEMLTCDEEKLKELGIWDKIYDKCKCLFKKLKTLKSLYLNV
jgi:hypothetical protein